MKACGALFEIWAGEKEKTYSSNAGGPKEDPNALGLSHKNSFGFV
jgi:hypothetical protein